MVTQVTRKNLDGLGLTQDHEAAVAEVVLRRLCALAGTACDGAESLRAAAE